MVEETFDRHVVDENHLLYRKVGEQHRLVLPVSILKSSRISIAILIQKSKKRSDVSKRDTTTEDYNATFETSSKIV